MKSFLIYSAYTTTLVMKQACVYYISIYHLGIKKIIINDTLKMTILTILFNVQI